MMFSVDFLIATVAITHEVGDARNAASHGPELLGGGSSENGVFVDLVPLDKSKQRLVAAARLVGSTGHADVPGSHVIVGRLTTEFIVQTATGSALILGRLAHAAVWTDYYLRFGHGVLVVP